MKRDVVLYVKDILENIELAEEFAKEVNYEEFVDDKKTNHAVIRCIEIMGEAAKNVPQSIREKYPQIPWKDIAGMRDKIIHFYFGVNLKRVWLVLKDDIPKLKPLVQKVLKDMENEAIK
jgi:uncharacterized protein with HEPN domain